MFYTNKELLRFFCLVILFCTVGCFSNNTIYKTYDSEPFRQNGRQRPLPPNAEPGKCYAQHFERQFHIDSLEFFEYVGNDFEQEGVEKREIEVTPGSVNWETKIDPNCKSNNPSNCQIRCLVEIPPKYENIYVVTDTNTVKNYNKRIIEKKRFGKTKPQWLEVICESQLTQNFFTELKNKLLEINYLNNDNSIFDRNTIKEAFTQYQKDNELPYGQFFVITLNQLGLKYSGI